MLLFSVPNVLPVDELLASTVTSVVTASESFLFYLVTLVVLKLYAF